MEKNIRLVIGVIWEGYICEMGSEGKGKVS